MILNTKTDYETILHLFELNRGRKLTCDDIHRKTGLHHNTIQRAINDSVPKYHPEINILREFVPGKNFKWYWIGESNKKKQLIGNRLRLPAENAGVIIR